MTTSDVEAVPKNRSTSIQVFLVHGTRGKKASFVRSDSLMWLKLEAAGATCHRFDWSGRNSHAARRAAALDLQLKIEELDSEIAIVGHSHGGNVALHAAWGLNGVTEKTGERSRKRGAKPIKIVTLATPFLFARGVPFTYATGLVLNIGSFLLGIWALFWATSILDGRPYSPHVLAVIVNIALAIAMALLFVSRVYVHFAHRGSRWPLSESAQCIQVPAPPSDQNDEDPPSDQIDEVLVIRAAEDEAAGALGAAQFSGWLTLWSTRIMTSTIAMLTIFLAFLAACILGLIAETAQATTALEALLVWPEPLLAALGILLAVPALASFAHGWDGPTISDRVLVTAEASPPGVFRVWQLKLRPGTPKGLAHSSVYEDRDVIDDIVRHVTERKLSRKATRAQPSPEPVPPGSE